MVSAFGPLIEPLTMSVPPPLLVKVWGPPRAMGTFNVWLVPLELVMPRMPRTVSILPVVSLRVIAGEPVVKVILLKVVLTPRRRSSPR